MVGAWKHFDQIHSDFAEESRNVSLGYALMVLLHMSKRREVAILPVIVTPYNLPPEMCMTKPYMF